MRRDMSLAGVGAVAFAVPLVVGFTLLGPKGGRYSDSEMASFVAQPVAGFIISIGLLVVSIGGLILLMAYLSEAWLFVGRLRRISWAASVVAAASFIVGWGLYLAPTSAIASGGPATDPGVTYVFVSAGMIVLFGVGGLALGTALVMLAARGYTTTGWIRALTGLAGLSALLTLPFLVASRWSPNQWLPPPFYLVILWGVVVGIWLIVSSRGTDSAPGV